MCLAIPMKLVELHEVDGTPVDGVAELRGVRRQVCLMLCPEAQVGDFLLIHAGYAISAVDEAEAERTLELLDAMALAGEGLS